MNSTILVVDDSEDDQHLYARAFKALNESFSLMMTSSAEAGLACLAECKPDLILLDYNLPDLDGLNFMRKLAEYSETPVPVIMLTGEGSVAVAVEAMKGGANDFVIKDAEGRYLRLLPGMAKRVIAAQEQREQVKRLQRRNQILMQNAMDGIHVMDMQGNVVEANDAFCKMLGYTPEEVAHLNVADWDAQWSAEELRERFEWLVGKSARFETMHRRKDGELINVEISTTGQEIDGQHFLYAASRDISERKKSEVVLMQHKLVLDTSIDGFWLTDLRGNLLEANEAYAKISGYAVNELVGMHISQLEATEQSPEAVRAHIEKIIAQGYDRFETRHRHQNGREIDIEISVTHMPEMERLVVFCRDITERKQAEAELLQENVTERKRAELLEQQFGHLLQNSFNEIYLFDAGSLRLLLSSEGAEKSLGYADDELSQLTLLDINPSYTRASFELLVAPLRSGEQQSLFFDTEHTRKDGTSYPVEILLQLMAEEAPVFLAVAQDITERRQADRLLRKSFAEIEDLYNHAPCGYHSLDKDGLMLMINDTELAWLGYTRSEVVGNMHWLDLVAPASHQAFLDSFPQFKQQGFVRDLEIELMRKDGTTLLGLVNATCVYDVNGDYMMSRSTVIDITRRKQAESQLARQREFTWHVIDTDPNLIYVKDADGRFLMVNQALADFCDMSSRQMIGKNDAMMNLGRKGLSGYLEPDVGLFKDGREIIRTESSLTVGGKPRWYLTIKKPLVQADGSFSVLGIAVDITGQKLSEMKLEESYKELQYLASHLENVREEERTRIARELHDEMGATLAALKMRAAWLASRLPPDAALLVEEAGHISGLVSDGIHTLRHIVSKLRPSPLEDIGFIAAIESYVGQFRQDTGIECMLALPDDELDLAAEQSAAIFRILQESLSNVVKHAQAGKVYIRLAKQEGELLMVVEDDGVGFAHGPKKGSFGLIGIRERALMIGGKAEISSVHGKGTRVSVSIPPLRQSTALAGELNRGDRGVL